MGVLSFQRFVQVFKVIRAIQVFKVIKAIRVFKAIKALKAIMVFKVMKQWELVEVYLLLLFQVAALLFFQLLS